MNIFEYLHNHWLMSAYWELSQLSKNVMSWFQRKIWSHGFIISFFVSSCHIETFETHPPSHVSIVWCFHLLLMLCHWVYCIIVEYFRDQSEGVYQSLTLGHLSPHPESHFSCISLYVMLWFCYCLYLPLRLSSRSVPPGGHGYRVVNTFSFTVPINIVM